MSVWHFLLHSQGSSLGDWDILGYLRVAFRSSPPPTKLSPCSPLARPQSPNLPAGLSLLAGWAISKKLCSSPPGDALCRVTETISPFHLTVGDASGHVRHPKHPQWLLLGGMSQFVSPVTRGTTGANSDAATCHCGHPEYCRRNRLLSLFPLAEENQGWLLPGESNWTWLKYSSHLF